MTRSTVLSESDEELLRALGQRDQEAVARLYHRYGSRMLAFARRYIPDETSAEDAVIDLFRRWLERPPRVRDFERLSAFLATSVYHAAIDWIRRDRAEQGQPPRPSTANPSTEGGHGFGGRTPIDPGPDVPRDVLAARLGSALSKLAGSDRLLLETHYGQALTVDECIALLRINRSAFHQRLHRARTRLARLLATDETAGDRRQSG